MCPIVPTATYTAVWVCLLGLAATQHLANTTTPSDTNQTNATTTALNGVDGISSRVEFFGDSNTADSDIETNPAKELEPKVHYEETVRPTKFKINTSDPLHTKEQSPNPFVSGRPRRPGAGIDPQLALVLQNNPRLRQLAEQNPEIAQQIYRNPRLLQNPLIQS